MMVSTELLACLATDENDRPRFVSKETLRHYEIELRIQGAPTDTYSVNYQLHDSYYDPSRESRAQADGFVEKFVACGDFTVQARIRTRTHVIVVTAELSQALSQGCKNAMSPAIAEAIADIRAHPLEVVRAGATVSRLLSKNLDGEAVAAAEDASHRLQAAGNDEPAAELHCGLALRLLAKGNEGWAVDEYYRAAAVHLSRGRVDRAKEVLEEALEAVCRRPTDTPQKVQLEHHVGLMKLHDRPVELLELLHEDFNHREKYDLRDSCAQGMRELERRAPKDLAVFA